MGNSAKASVRPRAREKEASAAVEGFEIGALLEYLSSGAVSEVVVCEVTNGTYRIEALLTWKPSRSVLLAAAGTQRTFRSIDTIVRFLRSMGIGKTLIRLELKI
jgi:hypothetical protein